MHHYGECTAEREYVIYPQEQAKAKKAQTSKQPVGEAEQPGNKYKKSPRI